MKIVIDTQVMENYGAHDWSGQGECPQYWKAKGGNTFVVESVNCAQAQDRAFWASVERHVAHRNESWEEYIVGMELRDDDYDSAEATPEWDAPIIVTIVEGKLMAKRESKFNFVRHGMIGKRETWEQREGEQEDFLLEYLTEAGEYVSYQDWSNRRVG